MLAESNRYFTGSAPIVASNFDCCKSTSRVAADSMLVQSRRLTSAAPNSSAGFPYKSNRISRVSTELMRSTMKRLTFSGIGSSAGCFKIQNSLRKNSRVPPDGNGRNRQRPPRVKTPLNVRHRTDVRLDPIVSDGFDQLGKRVQVGRLHQKRIRSQIIGAVDIGRLAGRCEQYDRQAA